MLNLYEQLSELDRKRIENYIFINGIAEKGYIGNEEYLKYWANCNKKLFHLLGGKLIHKIPFTYEKEEYDIKREIRTLLNKYMNRDMFLDVLESENFDKHYEDVEEDTFDLKNKIYLFIRDNLSSSWANDTYLKNELKVDFKCQLPGKKVLQLKKGMKPFRAIPKVLEYFEFSDKCKSLFEDFRIAYSMILNEKKVTGNLCFSIHPLDFMTMSDNASNWTSCMSWQEQGCYRIGSVEMMNSNNVLCCYLESNIKNYYFGASDSEITDEWTWNNKKWRELFYVTKDIIVGGKAYPFTNDSFTKVALEKLRELAKENLKWEYTFGPELYLDMVHMGTKYRIDRNREWIRNKTSIKNNIIFDTKGMYNDMFNDNDYDYFCVRNKVKRAKMISYSGKAPCLCCGDSVICETDEDDYYDYSDGREAYNERFRNVGNLLCEECQDHYSCSVCGGAASIWPWEDSEKESLKNFGYCKKCYKEHIIKCPCCGVPLDLYSWHSLERGEDIYIKLTEENLLASLTGISLQQFYKEFKKTKGQNIFPRNFLLTRVCLKCRDEMLANGLLVKKQPKDDIVRRYAWQLENEPIHMTTKGYGIDDPILKQYTLKID